MTNTLTAGWNTEFAHDQSKNEPDEYEAYDAYFYGNDDKVMGLDVTKEFETKNDTVLVGVKMYNEGYNYYNFYDPAYKKQPKLEYEYGKWRTGDRFGNAIRLHHRDDLRLVVIQLAEWKSL